MWTISFIFFFKLEMTPIFEWVEAFLQGRGKSVLKITTDFKEVGQDLSLFSL